MIYRIGAKYKCVPGGIPGIKGYCAGTNPVKCPGHIVTRFNDVHQWVQSEEHPHGMWVTQVREISKPIIIIGA